MLPAGPLPAPITDTSGCSRRQFTNLVVQIIEKEKKCLILSCIQFANLKPELFPVRRSPPSITCTERELADSQEFSILKV